MNAPEPFGDLPESTPPSAKSGLDNLPHFPSGAESNVPIRARLIPIVEMSAGALLALLPGLWVGISYLVDGSGLIAFLMSVGVALLIGVVTGLAVGHFTGPTGEFSVRTVLAAIPRVIFSATIGLLFGILFAVLGVIFIPGRRDDRD